jgi:hypothetical protein
MTLLGAVAAVPHRKLAEEASVMFDMLNSIERAGCGEWGK